MCRISISSSKASRLIGIRLEPFILHTKVRHPLASAAGKRLTSLSSANSDELAKIVEQNIEAIETHRREAESARNVQERIADAITWFSGSLPFVYFHAAAFVLWIAFNIGIAGLPAFDPYPFGMLTTIVSLEAIFLSTFVLVSQNRQALIAERRAELDLHINLLSEHEITRILIIAHEISKRLNIATEATKELVELEKDVKPESVLRELESRSNNKPPSAELGINDKERKT